VKTGDYTLRKKLLKKYPESILDVLQTAVSGTQESGVSLEEFQGWDCRRRKARKKRQAARSGGFWRKIRANILKAVEVFKKSTGRFHIDVAEAAALAIIEHIKKAGKAVESVTPAGSLRRGKETVGDLDLLVTLGEGHTSQKHVLYPRVDLAKGLLTAANALGGRAHQPRAISR
jgi:DNA polymerase (family 10)